MKFKFYSRHAIPTNLVEIISKIYEISISEIDIEHITEPVESIDPIDDEVVIGILPDSVSFNAIIEATKKASKTNQVADFAWEYISFSMKRERPKEGEATKPPTEIEAINRVQIFSGVDPVFERIKI